MKFWNKGDEVVFFYRNEKFSDLVFGKIYTVAKDQHYLEWLDIVETDVNHPAHMFCSVESFVEDFCND